MNTKMDMSWKGHELERTMEGSKLVYHSGAILPILLPVHFTIHSNAHSTVNGQQKGQ